MTKLAVFDFDGTLIPNPSSEWRFVLFLLGRGRLGSRGLLHAAAFALRWLPRFGRHVMKKNKAYLTGITVTEAEQLGEQFVQQRLLPMLRPHIVTRLREHQTRGDAVLLLTGAPSFIATPLCRALRVPHCLATECEIAQGRFSAKPPRRHPFGAGKLDLTRAFCGRLGYAMPQVTAYADSIHDRELLDAAGIAVAVDPDRQLRLLAGSRGWTVMEHAP